MEILAKDNQKKQELHTGAQYACSVLNNTIVPVARELSFTIDINDKELLDYYIRDINHLRQSYLSRMLEGANNPALSAVLQKSAEELFAAAYAKHPIPNPHIVNDIPAGILEYLNITGSGIENFHARPDNVAIEKSCIIEATPEDIAKKNEIKELCESLNACFNGMGGLFSAYIAIQGGKFSPIKNISNYKPIINGGY